jgi:hypothetical protein
MAPYLFKQTLVIQSVLRSAPVMHGVVKDLPICHHFITCAIGRKEIFVKQGVTGVQLGDVWLCDTRRCA